MLVEPIIMVGQARVLFSQPSRSELGVYDTSTMMLTQFGGGTSKMSSEPQKAKLTFRVAYLDSAQQEGQPSFAEFATIEGEIEQDSSGKRPLFTLPIQSEPQYIASEKATEPPRLLGLSFDPGTFRDTTGSRVNEVFIPLPPHPENAKYYEIGVSLEVANTEEAAAEKNDLLDLIIGPIEELISEVPLEQLAGLAKIMRPAHFTVWMAMIFGHDIHPTVYSKLRNELLRGFYKMPPIRILESLPQDRLAAFNKNDVVIEVVRSLLEEAEKDNDQATLLFAALIEEFGHFVDHDLRNRLSTVGGDAQLDEGARFGYALVNMQWKSRESATIARYLRKGQEVEIVFQWRGFNRVLNRAFSAEEQRSDDMTEAREFFGAGRAGNTDKSFGHQSIEDALRPVFKSKAVRLKIYFGNWLRDHSQAITPFSLDLLSAGARAGEMLVPFGRLGNNKVSQLHSNPRLVVTELLDIFARATFDDKPEFRVTEKRLGVYRAEEHIDNPTGLEKSSKYDLFNDIPSAHALGIDPVTQQANYISGSLAMPDVSSTQYMDSQIAAAIAAGETDEGYRLLGQALHVLEDFYSHSNFCELALVGEGKTTVEPWTIAQGEGNSQFYPLVTGRFGALDTCASIWHTLGSTMMKDLGHECDTEGRGIGMKMAVIMVASLRPHTAKNISGALDEYEEWKKNHPFLSQMQCRTVGVVASFYHFIVGALVLLFVDQIREYQTLTEKVPSIHPTHSQLAKDHDDHPLHSLAAHCAKIAILHVAEAVNKNWSGESGASTSVAQQIARDFIVHPDLIPPRGISAVGPTEVRALVHAWAHDTANLSAIKKASTRSVIQTHLNEMEKFGKDATKNINLQQIRELFDLS